MGKNYKGTIGICMARAQQVNSPEVLKYITEACTKAGYLTKIFHLYSQMIVETENTEGQYKLFEKVDFSKLTATLILDETIFNDGVVKRLYKHILSKGCPVINIGKPLKNCFSVLMDHGYAFKQIVEHVADVHGSKDICFFAGFKGNEFSEKRLSILKEVLAERNIPFSDDNVYYGDFWEYPTRLECTRMLNEREKLPDAIICANDVMAITVCECLNNRDINVPGDVIVTGFDRIEMERYILPRLTTASNDFEKLGEEVVVLLDKLIEDKSLEPYAVTIPHKLWVSESCGCHQMSRGNVGVYNRNIMAMYEINQRQENSMDRIFNTMSSLTVGESVMEMLKKMEDVIFSDKLANILHYDFTICVNKAYCYRTDVVLPKEMGENDYLQVMQLKDEEYSLPFKVIKDFDELSEEYAEKTSQVIYLPLNQQEEDYGFILLNHDRKFIDYEEMYEFMMSFNQVFGIMQKKAQLHYLIIRDPLTSLYNRRGFFSKVNKLIKKNPIRHKLVFVVSLDMDNLKEINDKLGHSEGDIALWTVSEGIKECIGEEGVSARFGGDEFVVAFISDEDSFEYDRFYNMSKSIPEVINKKYREVGKEGEITVSIGYAFGEIEGPNSIDEIMKVADGEMYDMKALHHSVKGRKGNSRGTSRND